MKNEKIRTEIRQLVSGSVCDRELDRIYVAAHLGQDQLLWKRCLA